MEISKYFTKVERCRICGGKIQEFLELGRQPPSNALRNKEDQKPKAVPLTLAYCQECSTVQLNGNVSSQFLFGSYLWVTGTSIAAREYKALFADELTKRAPAKKFNLLEIASNDGTFLREFKERSYEVLGVEPAKNLASQANKQGLKTLPIFFNEDNAAQIKKEHGHFDFVVARNVIPHVNNISSVIRGISAIMHNDSVGVIEFHDAKKIIDEIQYDSIYHEHIFYFTLKTIKQLLEINNLHLFDLERSPISGGAWVVFFSKSVMNSTSNLRKALVDENNCESNSFGTWSNFADKVFEHKRKVRELFGSRSKPIVGYGASARSSTVLNFCELNKNNIYSIIDKNPLKKGLITPGSEIPITSFEEGIKYIIESKEVLILSWNFEEEIIREISSHKFNGSVTLLLPNKIRQYAI